MIFKCPGQDTRKIKAEDIPCPVCGYEAEIFSDETKVRCSRCKNYICRKNIPNCALWCKFAQECIGKETFKQLTGGM